MYWYATMRVHDENVCDMCAVTIPSKEPFVMCEEGYKREKPVCICRKCVEKMVDELLELGV